MLKQSLIALRVTVLSVIALGLIYPFVMTGIAQLALPAQANGSIATVRGVPIGSSIIGQQFSKPQYFWGRPSAAGKGYDPTSTSGTDLGPTSKKLMDATRATIAALEKADPGAGVPPMDLVTSSASGIDPDISPEAAHYQAMRVAKARGLSLASVDALIAKHVRGRTFGVLGEPRVGVLELNLDLDASR